MIVTKKIVIAVAIISAIAIVAGIVALNWTQTTPVPTNSAQTWGGTHNSYDESVRDINNRVDTYFDRVEKKSTIPVDLGTIFVGAIIFGIVGLGWCGYEIRKKPTPAG